MKRANADKICPPRGGGAAAAIVIAATIGRTKRSLGGIRRGCGLGAFFEALSGIPLCPLRHAFMAVHRRFITGSRHSRSERPPHAMHAFHRSQASQRQRSERRNEHDEHDEFGYPPMHSCSVLLAHQARTGLMPTIARIITRVAGTDGQSTPRNKLLKHLS